MFCMAVSLSVVRVLTGRYRAREVWHAEVGAASIPGEVLGHLAVTAAAPHRLPGHGRDQATGPTHLAWGVAPGGSWVRLEHPEAMDDLATAKPGGRLHPVRAPADVPTSYAGCCRRVVTLLSG
jgi:hypothetical protein